jgi:hypothetical protein
MPLKLDMLEILINAFTNPFHKGGSLFAVIYVVTASSKKRTIFKIQPSSSRLMPSLAFFLASLRLTVSGTSFLYLKFPAG